MVPGGQHVCQVACQGQGEVGARCGATPNGASVEAPVEFDPGMRCCTRFCRFSSRIEGGQGVDGQVPHSHEVECDFHHSV